MMCNSDSEKDVNNQRLLAAKLQILRSLIVDLRRNVN